MTGDWDDPPLATLTHHFSLAPPHRGAAKTVEYAQRAAERAAGVLAYEEAARLYRVAIEALDQAPSDPALTCRLLLACGNAQNKAGDTLEAQETFRRAADTARALGSPQLLASAALGYGMPSQALAVWLSGSQAYEIQPAGASSVKTIASFTDKDVLQSGWLLGESVIAGKPTMVSVAYGQGRVVLYGFRVQHRDQTHGTYKLLFNALQQ